MSREPYGYIYKTIFPDGRYYIGQSKGSVIRRNYFGSGIYIRKYLSTHSTDLLKREIMLWVYGSQKDLNDAEALIIGDRYMADSDCVNLQPGGNKAGATPEFREKMRRLGSMPMSDSTRKKMSIIQTGEGNSFYGKKHSEATKEKMRKPHRTYRGVLIQR